MIDNYDRTGPILNGSVKPEGIDLIPIKAEPAELFRKMAQEAAYDISEMSTSTYMILRSQGDDRYTGLPVFPSRNFRHGYVFVNERSGCTSSAKVGRFGFQVKRQFEPMLIGLV
jgi:4,5-dihydroxyphthalate decarboxylase